MRQNVLEFIMGTRRAFVFTNFIFVVQNLFVLLLIWDVCATAPSPSLSFFSSSGQQQPVGRTLFASRPSRASRTSEVVFTSTQTPTDRQNLEDKIISTSVKQTNKGEKTNVLISLRSPSKPDSVTPLIKHMTVNLKDSASAVTPAFSSFETLSSVTGQKKLAYTSSSYSSSLSERFFRFNAHMFQIPPPLTAKIPTRISLYKTALFSFVPKQNFKTSSFTANNGSSFFSKEYGNSQKSFERKKDDKRTKEFISIKGKHAENFKVTTPATITSATNYMKRPLNYYSQDNQIERKTLYLDILHRKKKKSGKKFSDTQQQWYPNANAQTPLINEDFEKLSGDENHAKILSSRKANDQQLLRRQSSNSNIQILKEKREIPTSSHRFENKTQMQKSHDGNVQVSHLRGENISQIQNFSTSSQKSSVSPISLLPYLQVKRPNNVNNGSVYEKKSNSMLFLNTENNSVRTEELASKRMKEQRRFFSNTTIKINRHSLLRIISLLVKPVINEPKEREPPTVVVKRSSILLLSLLKQKTTPGLYYNSILQPKTDVNSVIHRLEKKLQHLNLHTVIPLRTDINEGVEMVAEQNENIADDEREINNIISGNSESTSEFILYHEPENRQKQTARHSETDRIKQTKTFITTRVYSSTLPARNLPAIHNMTTVSPLRAINRSLQKTARNMSIPHTKTNKHDGISRRHRRNTDKNKKYLHETTNSENIKQIYKHFKNQSAEYQVIRKNDSEHLEKRQKIAAPCKDNSKMTKVRKKRSFLSDYERYIALEESKQIKEEIESEKKRLAKGKLFNDGSLDEVFAVQSQPEPRKVKSHENYYETVNFSPHESKISISTLEFPPVETALIPPIVMSPESSKPLQMFKTSPGDTRESSVQRNQAEFGSGDELAYSFLIPCSIREKYYCLNGGTCLIVYTMDVKTCR